MGAFPRTRGARAAIGGPGGVSRRRLAVGCGAGRRRRRTSAGGGAGAVRPCRRCPAARGRFALPALRSRAARRSGSQRALPAALRPPTARSQRFSPCPPPPLCFALPLPRDFFPSARRPCGREAPRCAAGRCPSPRDARGDVTRSQQGPARWRPRGHSAAGGGTGEGSQHSGLEC